MEIEDTRHVTPDLYSIDDVRVDYDWSSGGKAKWVNRYLTIYLKPEGYLRDRFANGGSSYETKKHGARRIRLNAHELKQIMATLNNEVEICHQILLANGLIPQLAEARRKEAHSAQTQPE